MEGGGQDAASVLPSWQGLSQRFFWEPHAGEAALGLGTTADPSLGEEATAGSTSRAREKGGKKQEEERPRKQDLMSY